MGNIPELQRRRLASSVVGTAGVDTSNVDILQAVGQTAQTISSVIRKNDAERQRIVDETAAVQKFSDYETAISEETEALRIENKQDPSKATQGTLSKINKTSSIFSQGLNTPGAKSTFQRMVNASTPKTVRSMRNWAIEQDTNNTVSNYTQLVGAETVRGANAQSIDALTEVVGRLEAEGTRLGSNILGKKSADFTNEAVKESLVGYLENVAINDPKLAEQQLANEDVFKKLGGDRAETLKSIRSIGNANNAQKKLDKASAQDDNEKKILDDIVFSTDMNVAQKKRAILFQNLTGESDNDFTSKALKYIESTSSVDGITDEKALYLSLKEGIASSLAQYSNNKSLKTSEQLLKDISNTRSRVLDEASSGKINPTDAQALLSLFSSSEYLKQTNKAIDDVSTNEWFRNEGNTTSYLKKAIEVFENSFVDNPTGKYSATRKYIDVLLRGKKIGKDSSMSPDENSKAIDAVLSSVKSGSRQNVLKTIDKQIDEQQTISNEDADNFLARI